MSVVNAVCDALLVQTSLAPYIVCVNEECEAWRGEAWSGVNVEQPDGDGISWSASGGSFQR